MSIAEIFSVGGFLNNRTILVVCLWIKLPRILNTCLLTYRRLKWFSAIHIGAITATAWVLMLNAIVGYQLLDDGTVKSVGLVAGSGVVFFIGTGKLLYISLKRIGFGPNVYFQPTLQLTLASTTLELSRLRTKIPSKTMPSISCTCCSH